MISGIYKIENLINHKIYVGSTGNLKRRKNNHFSILKTGRHPNQHLQNSYNTYRVENFNFEIIEYIECLDNLIERENYWINFYKLLLGKENLYNIRIDAENNRGLHWNLSAETRYLISVSKKGENNPNFGKTLSEEARKKLSKIGKGRVLSAETRNNISKSRFGIDNPRIMKRETVLKIKEMLDNKVPQIKIHDTLDVCDKTIRKVKNGFYKSIYGID